MNHKLFPYRSVQSTFNSYIKMIVKSCSKSVFTILLPCVLGSFRGRTGINQATFSEFSWFTEDLRNPCSNHNQLSNLQLKIVSGNLKSRITSQQNKYFSECSTISTIPLTSLTQMYFDNIISLSPYGDPEDDYDIILFLFWGTLTSSSKGSRTG